MKIPVVKGKTSKLCQVFIQDSSLVNGGGITGITYASSGLTWYYYVEGQGAAVAVTPATMTLGTWASGGIAEINATYMPGWYQLGLPNAAIAEVSGGATVCMHLFGVTNMVHLPLELELTSEDDQVFSGLKKNRAFSALPFIMRDETTKLPLAGLSVTVQRLIDGGSLGVGGLNNVVNVGSGLYTVDGITSDVNGSYITFLCTATGADPTIFTVITVP